MLGVATHSRVSRSIDDINDPLHLSTQYLRYRNDSFEYAIRAGTVISIWFKRDSIDQGGALVGSWALDNGSESTSAPKFFHLYVGPQDPPVNITATQFQLRSYDEGAGAGNSSVNLSWSNCPNDTNWHHALVHISAWGNPSTATLYIDGVSLGSQTATGTGLNAHDNLFYKVIGIGRSALVNSGNTPVLYPTNASVPSVYLQEISTPWSLTVNQLWIGTVSSFVIGDFYQAGFVYLGTDGRNGGTKLLPTPAYYNELLSLTGLDLVDSNNTIVNYPDFTYETPKIAGSLNITIPSSNQNASPGNSIVGLTTNTNDAYTLETDNAGVWIKDSGSYTFAVAGSSSWIGGTPVWHCWDQTMTSLFTFVNGTSTTITITEGKPIYFGYTTTGYPEPRGTNWTITVTPNF